MSADEWSDAKRELFLDGSELLPIYHEGYLYLGIRANTPGMIVGNILVDYGDRVSILHSSATLGIAICEKSAVGFQQAQDSVWRCRSSSISPSAQANRDVVLLQQEGWVADNSYMGTPQELEHKIAMPSRSLRLAATFTPASDITARLYWPSAPRMTVLNRLKENSQPLCSISASEWKAGSDYLSQYQLFHN